MEPKANVTVYNFESAFFSFVTYIKDAATDQVKYKLKTRAIKSNYDMFHMCEEAEEPKNHIWRVRERRIFSNKLGIQYVQPCQSKEEAKEAAEVGWLKVKGWWDLTFNCILNEDITLKWRVTSQFTSFTMEARPRKREEVMGATPPAGEVAGNAEMKKKNSLIPPPPYQEQEQGQEPGTQAQELVSNPYNYTLAFAVLNMTSDCRFQGNIIIRWDPLLQHYPAYKGREIELESFLLTTALISKMEWDVIRQSAEAPSQA